MEILMNVNLKMCLYGAYNGSNSSENSPKNPSLLFLKLIAPEKHKWLL